MFRCEVRGYSPVLWRYRRDWSFVYTAHPLEQFLCIGPVDILAFGAAVIPVAIAGADRFCVSLLAFKLRNDRFSFHFFCRSFRLVGSLLAGNRCLIPNEVDFSWSC